MLIKRLSQEGKENKLIFIHMPKTAGTSIEAALGINVDMGAGSTGNRYRNLHLQHYGTLPENPVQEDLELLKKYRHKNLSFIMDEDKGKPEDYFKFTVLRNTYDRFWSSYLHHTKPDGGVKLPFIEYVRHLKNYHENPGQYTFNDAHNTGEEENKPWLYMNNTRISHVLHFVKLDYWFDDINEFDYLIRYERLYEGWNYIKSKFSFGDLPHKGPNMMKYRQEGGGRLVLRGNNLENYRSHYTPETKSILEEVHGEEIEYFKYKF